MRGIILTAICIMIVLPSIIFAQEKLTLEKIYKSADFSSVGLSQLQWNTDGQLTYYKKDTIKKVVNIVSFDPKTKQENVVLSNSELDYKFNYGQIYKWSPDSKYILFTERLKARRDKSGGRFIIVDVENKKVTTVIESSEDQELAEFSPDGKKIGFVRSNNLFVYDIESGIETRLTVDGNENILNGKFDWVYEEEFSNIYAWQWSPDSKNIAYWQLDQTEVPTVQIAAWDSLYFNAVDLKYPKAGGNNPKVKIGVVDIEKSKTTWMNIEKEEDFYIPRIKFTNDPNILSVQRLNRDQNNLELILCDVKNGQAKTIVTDKYDTWIKVNDNLQFLIDGKHFIWNSEIDGFSHIYLYDINGKLIRQVTKGEFEVDEVASIDEANEIIYYTSNETNVANKDLFKINFSADNKNLVTSGKGTNSVKFSTDSKYYVNSFSNTETNTVITLNNADGSLIETLKAPKENVIQKYDLSKIEFSSFETTDGVTINFSIMKPKNFDQNKKYPLLVYNYSGPGSQVVLNSWRGANYAWHSYLNDNDIMVAWFDNRGTGGRGKEFRDHVYKRLGDFEINDIVEGINYLVAEGFVDMEKIAIWGWSYGGYVSALAIAKVPYLFNCAISVAPVTDWKFYDSIYTERYMSTPNKNPEGYKNGSVLNYAKNIKGKLLLVHGTADDNVHFQNTVKLAEELIENNVQFETIFYPEKDHGIRGGNSRYHLFTYLTNFLINNLK